MEIVNVALSSLLLAGFTIVCKVYLIRSEDWKELLGHGWFLPMAIELVNWFLLYVAGYHLVRLFQRGDVKQLAFVLAIILPNYLIRKGATNKLVKSIDDYLLRKFADRYQVCPHCQSSQIFFLEIVGRPEICYYLVNRDNQLVFLGLEEDLEHLATLFLHDPRPFSVLVKRYARLLSVVDSTELLIGDRVYQTDEQLICNSCSKIVSDIN